MNDAQELNSTLNQFIGGDPIYFQKMFPPFHYTEGFRFFVDQAGGGAYWLFLLLATEPAIREHFKKDRFASVKLFVNEDKSFHLTVDDGNGNMIYEHKDYYTDCPRLETNGVTKPWQFFMENSQVGDKPIILIMLPQER
jgi:hypothetical protein